MIDTNYPLDALPLLLEKDVLLARYHALMPYREALLLGLRELGCKRKNDVLALSDMGIIKAGLPDALVPLFRRFLTLYDPAPQKFREISKVTSDPGEASAFRELYHLPGVRHTRAELYFRAGFRSLYDIASVTPEELLEKTARVISEQALPYAVPLPKEARTHVAVAKAFTYTKQNHA